MKHIILATDSTALGGAELYLIEIAKELKKHQCHLHLMTSSKGALYEKIAQYTDDTTLVTYPYIAKPLTWWKCIPFFIKNAILIKKLEKNVTYIVNDVYPNWAVTWLKHFFDIKVISLWQGEYVFEDDRCAKKWLRNGALKADKRVASGPVAHHLKERNILKANIDILNPRSDFSRFKPELYDKETLRKQYNFNPKDKIAICVGQVGPPKGQEWLVTQYLNSKILHENWKLLIVGPIKSQTNQFWEKINHPNIHVLGLRHDIPELYALADIAIFPGTISESYGLAVLEAAMMQKPILATNAGAITYTLGKNFPGLHNRHQRETLIQHWESGNLSNLIPPLPQSIDSETWTKKLQEICLS